MMSYTCEGCYGEVSLDQAFLRSINLRTLAWCRSCWLERHRSSGSCRSSGRRRRRRPRHAGGTCGADRRPSARTVGPARLGSGPWASSVYVASVEGYTGKSTVALGLLEQLSRRVERVGGVPPRGARRRAEHAGRDYVLDLLVSHDAVTLSYDECAGVTYDDVHRDPDAALDRIVERYHQVADQVRRRRGRRQRLHRRGRARPSSPSTPGSRPTSAHRCCSCSTGPAAAPTTCAPMTDLAVGELNANHGTLFAVVANRVDERPVDRRTSRRSTAPASRPSPCPRSRC